MAMTEIRIAPIVSIPSYISEKTNGAVVRSIKTVREWAAKGTIKSRKIAGSVFVELESVDQLLNGDDSEHCNSD